MKWFVLALTVIMYALVIAFQNKKVWFTSSAAVIILILGLLIPGAVFPLPEDIIARDESASMHLFALSHAFADVINWDVLLMYLGSMILAALFIYSKVPEKIANALIAYCKKASLAFTALIAFTGILSIFTGNAAALLTAAPVAMSLCKKLGLNPVFLLCSLAITVNMEGAASLTGSVNAMIFSGYTGLSFKDFFIRSGKASIFFAIQASLLISCIFYYILFTKKTKEKVQPEYISVKSYFPMILLFIMIAALTALSFVHTSFDLAKGLITAGLGLIGIAWYRLVQKQTRTVTLQLIKNLDCQNIFFLAGIFIVTGAFKACGLSNDLALFFIKVTGESQIGNFLFIMGLSIIAAGLTKSLPYLMLMIPVADIMSQLSGIAPELYIFALLAGSCLGESLRPNGSYTNRISLELLEKDGFQIGAFKWFKIAAPFTLLSAVITALILWLTWL